MSHRYYRTTKAAKGHANRHEYLIGFHDPLLGPLYCSLEEAHGPEIAAGLVLVPERAVPGKTLQALRRVLTLSTAVD